MRKYTFYWDDGTREVLTGTDVLSALSKAGYTSRSLIRLSFYLPDENRDFYWDKKTKRWSYSPCERLKDKPDIHSSTPGN